MPSAILGGVSFGVNYSRKSEYTNKPTHRATKYEGVYNFTVQDLRVGGSTNKT